MANPKLDRLPPHSVESEQGVLGCLLLDPSKIGEAVEYLVGGSAEFYDLRHQSIYEHLVAMWDERKAIDMITFQQRLKDANQFEAVGGLAYISSLPDTIASVANLPAYLEEVQRKYFARRIIQTATSLVQDVYDNEWLPLAELLDKTEQALLSVSQQFVKRESLGIKELIHGAISQIENSWKNHGALDGLATGYQDLDRLTGGLKGGDMIIIAARPSMGKTSLAMNISEDIAVNQKIPVGVFSLEMSAPALALRALCSRARVNLRNVNDGFLAERDFPKLTAAAGAIAKSVLYIDDTPGLTVLQLRAKARRMIQQHHIKLLVIDYLQLLLGSGKRFSNRQEEVSAISSGIKLLARELNVPIIVLSQLNREIEKEKNRKPRLSDLRESGSLEQDADVVGLLYRATKDDEDSADESDAMPVNLLIAKHRNGPTGDVSLVFLKNYTRFESAAKISDDSVPYNPPHVD